MEFTQEEEEAIVFFCVLLIVFIVVLGFVLVFPRKLRTCCYATYTVCYCLAELVTCNLFCLCFSRCCPDFAHRINPFKEVGLVDNAPYPDDYSEDDLGRNPDLFDEQSSERARYRYNTQHPTFTIDHYGDVSEYSDDTYSTSVDFSENTKRRLRKRNNVPLAQQMQYSDQESQELLSESESNTTQDVETDKKQKKTKRISSRTAARRKVERRAKHVYQKVKEFSSSANIKGKQKLKEEDEDGEEKGEELVIVRTDGLSSSLPPEEQTAGGTESEEHSENESMQAELQEFEAIKKKVLSEKGIDYIPPPGKDDS